jgi:sugar lactone lactonase YvrE
MNDRSFPKLRALAALALATAASLHASDKHADEHKGKPPGYETRVVVRDLERPTGIVAQGSGVLYLTQLPTPGVGGMAGGRNTVDKINLWAGRLTNLTMGEPEPTNLALDKHGNLYWTCKSAGVILERSRHGEVSVFLRDLPKPSGIAVDRRDNVYFTLLPTPGVPGTMGGMNTVNVTDGDEIEVLTMGEPEPTDIAVSRDGNAYWTCKSANVILCRSAAGEVRPLLRDLDKPVGIALDHRGRRLFFTEVPTPGVPGTMGGRNKVSVYDLRTGELEVVDFGDPEPTDVTVALNGSIFWTCSSAGVIVQARRLQPWGE